MIRSWLLDLLVRALDEDPELDAAARLRQDSGEGRWTVQAAVDHAVPLPVITAALYARFASRQEDSPGDEGDRRAAQPVRRPRGRRRRTPTEAATAPQPVDDTAAPATSRVRAHARGDPGAA